MPPSSPSRCAGVAVRYAVYTLLIVAACASVAGRTMSIRSDRGGAPFLSANDRSRWCAVRALVDKGTFAIDDVILRKKTLEEVEKARIPSRWIEDYETIKRKDGTVQRYALVRDPEWHTIDKVYHKAADGKWHYYSSKPPLYIVMLSGQYYAIKAITGRTIDEEPFYIGRFLILINNVIPLAIMLVVISRIVDGVARTDWARYATMTVACLGTFLTTFAITINNHLPAAAAVAIGLLAVLTIWRGQSRGWWWFALAGFFGAFAAANELPALAFFALAGLACLIRSPLRTLAFGVPAAALVGAAFFGANYWAHGVSVVDPNIWRPPYAHWGDGAEIARLDPKFAKEPSLMSDPPANDAPQSNVSAPVTPEFKAEVHAKAIGVPLKGSKEAAMTIRVKDPGKRWYLWDYATNDRYSVVRTGETLALHAWDNWYEYPTSYWTQGPVGIDKGEEDRADYLFHMTLGHHGIFSLTPIWIFAMAGGVQLVVSDRRRLRWIALAALTLTVVVLAFYVSRPVHQRNYGGMTCGLRWMFWFIPMWLMMLPPALDRMGQWSLCGFRFGRWIVYAAVAISVFSAHYTPLNPWRSPWLHDYWRYLEWLE